MSESDLHKEWSRLFSEGKAGYPYKAWLERRRRQEERAFIEQFVDAFDAVETLEEGDGFGAASEAGRESEGETSASPSPSSSVPTGSDQFPIPNAVQEQIAKQRSRSERG